MNNLSQTSSLGIAVTMKAICFFNNGFQYYVHMNFNIFFLPFINSIHPKSPLALHFTPFSPLCLHCVDAWDCLVCLLFSLHAGLFYRVWNFIVFFLPPGLSQSFWSSLGRLEWWMDLGFIILSGPTASRPEHSAPTMVSPSWVSQTICLSLHASTLSWCKIRHFKDIPSFIHCIL